MVGRKEKIILIFTLFFVFMSSFAHENSENRVKERKKSSFFVSYGIKGGFNSSMFLIDRFVVNGATVQEIENNYRLGYNLSAFARFNINRHFIQLGPEISIINSEIKFDKKASQHPDVVPDYASIISNIKSINVPLVYGYNIVDESPYSLSIFTGPVFKYIWRNKSNIDFVNFSPLNIQEALSPFALNLTVGLSVKISYIFFDFAYEIGLNNISKEIKAYNLGSQVNGDFNFDRRNNTLSFSFGCSF